MVRVVVWLLMDRRVADEFLDHFRIRPKSADRDLLRQLGQAFGRLPYENISKLIKKHRLPPTEQRRRSPGEVFDDHVALGTGGTCFALTQLFGQVLERLGYRSFPVLCDTKHQAAGHCALIAEVGDEHLLLDPGYLVHEPLALTHSDAAHHPEAIRLISGGDGRSLELHSFGVRRYRFIPSAASPDAFFGAWDASFDWTMMNDVHVCAPIDHGYAYVHGHKLRLRDATAKHTVNIRGDEAGELGRRFGIDTKLIEQAYQLVARRKTP